MSRPRPPYLQRERTRHGKIKWFVRRGDGPRTRVLGEYGSPEFMANYQAAVAGHAPPVQLKSGQAGSLKWLIDRYRDSSAWAALSKATHRQRDNIFSHIVREHGDVPFAEITRAAIVAGRERRKETPSQAKNFLDAMRGVFRWALEAELIENDPTANVKNPPKKKGRGFPVWSEDEVAAYQARWPVGTRQRVWLDVLLYTGLRRGDAVQIGRQHVRDGVISWRTEKSGQSVEVSIPILPELAATLKAGPTGDLAFICGASGKPLTKESFGNFFKVACKQAGIADKSAHGLRKIGATRAANNGATVAELEAIFGWQGGQMAALYTREADRRRLAQAAIGKLSKNAR